MITERVVVFILENFWHIILILATLMIPEYRLAGIILVWMQLVYGFQTGWITTIVIITVLIDIGRFNGRGGFNQRGRGTRRDPDHL